MRKIFLLIIISIIVIAGCTQSLPTINDVDKEGGGTLTVMMSGVTFMPPQINVKQGDEIRFMNINSYTHTVTIPELDIDQTVSAGQSFTVKVDKTGTFDLQCTIHVPKMVGKITST